MGLNQCDPLSCRFNATRLPYQEPLFSSGVPRPRMSGSKRVLPEGMEEWGFVDDRELQNWKGGVVCMTASTSLWRRSALPHDGGVQPQAEAAPTGEHLKKCKLWAPTWQKEMVWALGRATLTPLAIGGDETVGLMWGGLRLG